MEKTSKALLIAGAVLIAIILISMGTLIINNVKSTIASTTTIDELNQQTYNAKYELARGIRSGSAVKEILNYAIMDNNKLEQNAKKENTIDMCLNVKSNSDDILDAFKSDGTMYYALTTRNHGVRYVENIQRISNIVLSNNKYNIWYTYNSFGYVWQIHIDKVY